MKIIVLKTLIIFNIACVLEGLYRTENISVVILSQANQYNKKLSDNLKLDLCEQASTLRQKCPSVYLSHEDFRHVGEWALIPILPRLADILKDSSWIILLEDRSIVRLKLLLEVLEKYDSNQTIWLGYSLEDSTLTIIHHFQETEFNYPHFGAGIVLSNPLLQSLSERVLEFSQRPNFNIDKAFEFASFVWNEGNGTLLTHESAFCTRDNNETCATFPGSWKSCSTAVPVKSIYFAVKTCSKFHHDRVPVVLNTWGNYVENIEFFSDISDPAIPTVALGIPNTESGHCGKTMALIKYLAEKIENDISIRWIVIVDDDTILSVSRMLELLSCYNSTEDIAIGERYGYGVYSSIGFNYLTGGAGMVFSRVVVKKLAHLCECPSISSPDDMVIGHCLSNLGIEVTHSHLFHQARPVDYSPDFLESDRHVSFHKHWMLDPIEVYNQWFADYDIKLKKKSNIHYEL